MGGGAYDAGLGVLLGSPSASVRPLTILGDSQACGAGNQASVVAPGRPARVLCKVGSRVAEWPGRLAGTTVGPDEDVLVFLGSNDFDSRPDPRPLAQTLERTGARWIWIGPPSIRGGAGTAPDALAEALGSRYFDSRTLGLSLPDGIHPSASEYQRWLRIALSLIAGAKGGEAIAPTHVPSGAPDLPGVDAAFWPKLANVAKKYGADPRTWLLVFMAESDITPSATNPRSGAVGINQFVPSQHPEIPAGFASMPASKQLDFTERFWAPFYRKFGSSLSARDLYWLNFRPASYQPGAPDDFLILPATSTAAKNNPNLQDPDGAIRAGSISRFLESRQLRPRWAPALALLSRAGGGEEAFGALGVLGVLSTIGLVWYLTRDLGKRKVAMPRGRRLLIT